MTNDSPQTDTPTCNKGR